MHLAAGFAAFAVSLSLAFPAFGLECPVARELRSLDADSAETRARACLAGAPDDPQRMLALSQVLAWRDRHAEALIWANAAVQRAPDDLDLAAWRLRLLGWLSRHDEARDIADALPPAPEHRELALVRADLARWRGDDRAADAAYSQYLERWPDDRGARRSLGATRMRLGDETSARRSFAALCAEGDTEACVAARAPSRSDVTLVLQAGPVVSSGEGSGWRGRAELGGPASRRIRLRGAVELEQRSQSDDTLRDTRLDGGATWQALQWLSLDLGAGFAPNPTFSSKWNAHAEAGFELGAGFTLLARYWHIEFAHAGVEVLSPALAYHGGPVWATLRLWRSIDPAGDGTSFLGQFGFQLTPDVGLSVGSGGGDKADYLTVRDVPEAVQRHLVALAGLTWAPTDELQLRLDYVGRRESIGDDRLMRHEILVGAWRKW